MKNSFKVALSLTLTTSLLAISQLAVAAPTNTEEQLNNATFTPDASQRAECQTAPKPLVFLYSRDIKKDAVTLTPKDATFYKAINEDAHMRDAKYVYFTDSILRASDTARPLHLFGRAELKSNDLNENHNVIYWYYTNGQSTPCRGTVTLVPAMVAPMQK